MLSPPPRPLSFLLLIHLLHLLLTPPPLLPSPFSHSCYQIKCQTEREGGWMAHISSYRGRPVYCCTLQSVPCYSFLRSAPTPPAHPKPGSLAADWVVIVIKSSCTASEYTKLSANGWSSVGGWPGDGGGFVGGLGWGWLWSLSTLSQLIVDAVLFIIIVRAPAPESGREKIITVTLLRLFEDEKRGFGSGVSSPSCVTFTP